MSDESPDEPVVHGAEEDKVGPEETNEVAVQETLDWFAKRLLEHQMAVEVRIVQLEQQMAQVGWSLSGGFCGLEAIRDDMVKAVMAYTHAAKEGLRAKVEKLSGKVVGAERALDELGRQVTLLLDAGGWEEETDEEGLCAKVERLERKVDRIARMESSFGARLGELDRRVGFLVDAGNWEEVTAEEASAPTECEKVEDMKGTIADLEEKLASYVRKEDIGTAFGAAADSLKLLRVADLETIRAGVERGVGILERRIGDLEQMMPMMMEEGDDAEALERGLDVRRVTMSD